MSKGKGTSNDLQNNTQKTKDLETRTQLKTGSELMCSGRVGIPAPLVAPFVLI